MNIALVGGTCVGKTTIMKLLVEKLGGRARSCGRVVFETATLNNVLPENLSDEAHRKIDNETRDFCTISESIAIIDGRYLQYVLSGLSDNLAIVELVAEKSVRANRAITRFRDNDAAKPDIVLIEDCRDMEFCRKMYSSVDKLLPDISIDTSNSTPDEIIEKIMLKLNI